MDEREQEHYIAGLPPEEHDLLLEAMDEIDMEDIDDIVQLGPGNLTSVGGQLENRPPPIPGLAPSSRVFGPGSGALCPYVCFLLFIACFLFL